MPGPVLNPIYESRVTGREQGAIFAYTMEIGQGHQVYNKVNGGGPMTFSGDELATQGYDKIVGPYIRFTQLTTGQLTDALKKEEGSVDMMVRLRTLPSGGGLAYLQYAITGSTRYHIYIQDDGTGSLFTRFGDSAARDTGVDLIANKWYRITGKWVDVAVPGNASIYVDGDRVDNYSSSFADDATPIVMDRIDGDLAEYVGTTRFITDQRILDDYRAYARRCEFRCICDRARVSSVDEGGVVDGRLSNTPWRFADTTGRWKIVDVPSLGRDAKMIECTTAGILYTSISILGINEVEAAYGTPRIMLRRGPGATTRAIVIASVPRGPTDPNQNGYQLSITSLFSVRYERIDSGVITTLFASATGVVTDAPYDYWIPRRTRDGRIHVFTNGKLVTPTGGYTNPFTDNTHKSSKYLVLQLSAGDRVGLIRRHFGEFV